MAKKITRATLNELAKEMALLSEQEQQAYLGGAGYDEGDCWWRCIAYLKNCHTPDGTIVPESEAMEMAKKYYGSQFDSSEYSFTGNVEDHKKCIDTLFEPVEGDHCSGTILVYDPTPYDRDRTNMHAVIVQNISLGVINAYDPQTGKHLTLQMSDVNASYAKAYKVK